MRAENLKAIATKVREEQRRVADEKAEQIFTTTILPHMKKLAEGGKSAATFTITWDDDTYGAILFKLTSLGYLYYTLKFDGGVGLRVIW